MKKYKESSDTYIINNISAFDKELKDNIQATYGDHFLQCLENWVSSQEYGENNYYLVFNSNLDAWIENNMNLTENAEIFSYAQGRDIVSFNTAFGVATGLSKVFLDNYLESITSISQDVVFKINYQGKDIMYSVNQKPGEKIDYLPESYKDRIFDLLLD